MPKRRSGRAGSPAPLSQLQLFSEPPASPAAPSTQTVRCRQCRKAFSQPRWYAERGLRLFFCSNACKAAWEQDAGTARLAVRLTGRPKRRGGNWKDLVDKVRERDGYRCRSCGITEQDSRRRLDVHHRVPARLFASMAEANTMKNLIALCASCHKRMEDRGERSLPLFTAVGHPGRRSDHGDPETAR